MRNRGQGSIIRRRGTKNLYIRYYAADGRQIQEAVGSHVKEVAGGVTAATSWRARTRNQARPRCENFAVRRPQGLVRRGTRGRQVLVGEIQHQSPG